MKMFIGLLLASALVGCKNPSPGGAGASYAHADYEADLKGEDLGCCIIRDVLHKPPQALQKGQSNVGETASWTTADNALQMTLKAPPTIMENTTPSMGVFSTGLNLGPGSRFSVSATFRKPSDTLYAKGWAVGVVARTGDRDDTADLKRLQLTFRVKNSTAELRVQEIWGPTDAEFKQHASLPVPQTLYDQLIDNQLNPPTFTLKLLVDRKTGTGDAMMKVRNTTYDLGSFNMEYFKASSGDPFTVVGAALANAYDAGKTRSVEVTHFEVWTH